MFDYQGKATSYIHTYVNLHWSWYLTITLLVGGGGGVTLFDGLGPLFESYGLGPLFESYTGSTGYSSINLQERDT